MTVSRGRSGDKRILRVILFGAVLALLLTGSTAAWAAASATPELGATVSKSRPGIDTVAAVTVTAPQAGSTGKVSQDQLKISVTEWLVAPGNTPKQLHDKLKAQGVPGRLVDPDTEDLEQVIAASVPAGYPPEPTDGCTYGTAHSFSCPAPHWARNGFPNPRVYFNDLSSSAWPVGTVIDTWNQSPNIAPRWAPSGCPGTAGSHCVWVNNGGYGDTSWLGITYMCWDGNLNICDDGSIGVRFNDYYSSSHQAVACHEIGHALGMGHNDSNASCLYSVDPHTTSPSSQDFWILANVVYP